MHMSIQLLHDHDYVRTTLSKDGWHLQAEEQPNDMRAKHPEIQGERAARQRLNELGLLTSRSCRIEFRPESCRNGR